MFWESNTRVAQESYEHLNVAQYHRKSVLLVQKFMNVCEFRVIFNRLSDEMKQMNESNIGSCASTMNINSSKMVVKFGRYSWKELQLETARYVLDGVEELGNVGIQSEEVHESNKNFLWHIIKQLRPGMDLSKVTLPTFILEPRSFLEKLADYYYHCDILSEAVMIDDPVIRLINIVKWYLSGFYKKPKGPKKPYNPILGEKFRCFWDHPKTQSRTFFVAEQVSHHPPISAFHVSNKKDGYTITCALLSRSKFGGNSVSAILDGTAKLYLSKRQETYTLTMPFANCRGILLGSLCLELGGKVKIECAETGCKCELDFKLAPVWANSSSYNTLTGKVTRFNKVTHSLEGHWDKKITIIDKNTKQKSILWEVTDSVRNSRLKRYTVAFQDQGERESAKLWSKVTEALQNGDQTMATVEKTKLEDEQRKEAKDREGLFVPDHFILDSESSSWIYRWHDERSWDERRDIMQFEDNFKIKTLMMEQSNSSTSRDNGFVQYNPVLDMPLTKAGKLSERGEVEHELGVDFKALKDKASHRGSGMAIDETGFMCNVQMKTIEEAISQIAKSNKKLEEDLADLRRSMRVAALVVAAFIVMIGAFLKYYIQ